MLERANSKNLILSSLGRFKQRLYPILIDWKGFVVLLAVLLPFKILRAGQENSLWIDEIYTLLLVGKPWKEIIHLTAIDDHPPLYYGLLKAWIILGGNLGWLNELLWARLLNIVLWVFFCFGMWFAGRQLLGKSGGTLLSWGVAAGAQLAQVTKDLRSYSTSVFSVFLCFLLIFIIENRRGNKGGIRKYLTDGVLWGLYTLSGLVALYSHLLTSFAVLLLGLCWLYLVCRKREGNTVFLWGGGIAQGVMLILFAPWFFRIMGQVAYIQSSNLFWMTPPSFWNLIRIFIFWFPYGQIPDPPVETAFYVYVAGGLSFILPWGAFLCANYFSRRENAIKTPARTIAVFSGLVSILFVLILFLIRHMTGIPVFHGPRYPCLVTPIWAAGLVAAALYAADRLKRPLYLAFLLLIPWFLCNVVGQIWFQTQEKNGGLVRWMKLASGFMPAKGEPLYILPSELIPYYKNSLKDFNVKTIEEMVDPPPQHQDILVLNMNPWKVLRSPRDTIILSLIEEGHISREVEKPKYKMKIGDFQSFRLKGLDRIKIQRLFKEGIKPAKRDIPDSAVAIALPEDQWFDEGWSVDEVDSKGNLFRWAMGTETKVRFNGSIMPGMYILHFVGQRTSHPSENVDMYFAFERQLEMYKISQSSGYFHFEIPVMIILKHINPILKVRHPVWRPMDVEEGSKDARPLTFLFLYAWLEPGSVK